MPPVDVAPDNDEALPEQAAQGALVVADEVGKALAEVVKTNTTITAALVRARELHATYKDVAFDCDTTEGMEAARKARAALRDEGRYVVQNLKDVGSKMLGTMQRQFNAACEEYITEIKGYERPIDDQIKAVEERKERERQARAQAEEERRQRHAQAIAAIAALAADAAGLDSKALEEHIANVQSVIVDDSYEEFQAQAQAAKDKALMDLGGMLIAARLDEQERAEMEAERARIEAVRVAQEQRERDLAEREAEMARQQAAQAAEAQRLADEAAANQRALEERRRTVQHRIDSLATYGAAYSHMAAPQDIEGAIRTLHDTPILPDYYDDRTPEAELAKANALHHLRGVLAQAVEREAEEARKAAERERAASIEKRIQALRDISAEPGDSSEDLAAGMQELRAAMERHRFSDDLFGDRAEEAWEAVGAALIRLEQGRIVALEREAEEAREAERQRIEQQRMAHERMRQQLMRDNAVLLFEASAALVGCIERGHADIGELNRLTDDVRNILNRIPKEQA